MKRLFMVSISISFVLLTRYVFYIFFLFLSTRSTCFHSLILIKLNGMEILVLEKKGGWSKPSLPQVPMDRLIKKSTVVCVTNCYYVHIIILFLTKVVKTMTPNSMYIFIDTM